jgi:hypothetical protein
MLGWIDSATPLLEGEKQKNGLSHRADIQTMADLIDFDEQRKS